MIMFTVSNPLRSLPLPSFKSSRIHGLLAFGVAFCGVEVMYFPNPLIDKLLAAASESNSENLFQWKRAALSLARHIRNPDEIPLLSWGTTAVDLLAHVRELDPDLYAEFVAKPEPKE